MPVNMNIKVLLEDAVYRYRGWGPIRIIAYGHSHQRFKDNQNQGHTD
jgi:hypothetical protein